MPYGDGSVIALPNGKWRADKDFGLTATGRRRRISATGRTEAEARRRLKQREKNLNRTGGSARRQSNADKKTVSAYSEDWLKRRVEEVRPKTYSSDLAAVRHYIVPAIGRLRLTDVMPPDVREVNRAVRDAGHGESTVLRVQRIMVKMLRDALEDGYVVPDPVFNIKVAKQFRGRHKPKRLALDFPQSVAVLGQATKLDHGVRWLVGFYEGMRQAEILGLTWDAIDFETGFISLEWQLQALPYNVARDRTSGFRVPNGYESRHLAERFHLVRPKTDEGWREIPVVKPVRDALLAWREIQPPNPYGLVFTRADGRPIDKADDAEEFRRLQAAVNVKHPSGRPYVGHEIRNATATVLAELGVEQTIIKAIMGHSSYATTQGYIAARRAPMIAAMEAVHEAFTTKALTDGS